jgi:Fe-S cluster assembly ATP-binding protein
MLKIEKLKASIENKNILNGIDLSINKGEMMVLMGQNGSGKSTLSQVIMGSPFYKVEEGVILFNGKNIMELDVTERAKEGIFLSFQYPSEIEGVSVSSYLRLIHGKRTGQSLSPIKFRKLVKEYLDILKIDEEFLKRHLNEGFSGGEKKRMEMLQMLVLSPEFIMLDEVDSGLDVDALKVVADAVNYLHSKGSTFLVITHYSRILNYLKPDKVAVMSNGKIIKEGGTKLVEEIEKDGYAGTA